MFGFYESDWFTITLEVLFLIFIAYDAKKYFETRKREYLINIALAVGFFVWAFIPFYNKYYTWQDNDKSIMIEKCSAEFNASYCECLDDKYTFEVGGKNKKFTQIKDMKDSYVISDDIEIGSGNKIPLWLFGFLY